MIFFRGNVFYPTKNKSRKTWRKMDLKGKCVFPHNFSQFLKLKKRNKSTLHS
jgi:hypothetical protein